MVEGLHPGSTYRADLIGGLGARCPGLLPNSTLMKEKSIMFESIFPNGDGILAFVSDERSPILARMRLTDSKHYLLPINNRKQQTQRDIQGMLDLIEARIQRLFGTFSRSRRPQLHLHASSSDRYPEAQNQE
eukprot:3471362-Pyramimonas_sp.AAC.1